MNTLFLTCLEIKLCGCENLQLGLLEKLLLEFPKYVHDNFIMQMAQSHGNVSVMKKVKSSLQRKMVLIYRLTSCNQMMFAKGKQKAAPNKTGNSGELVSQISII